MIHRDDFIKSIGAPDDRFNSAMDQALLRIAQTERSNIVKRKMTLSLLAAIITLLILAGAALAVGVNLFDFFGKDDERLSILAPQSELETSVPGTVESDVLGQTRATLNNGYYDGQNLIIAFTLENSECYAPFTPTEEQLALLEKANGESNIDYDENMPGAEAGEAFMRAMDAGEPCGFAKYCVYPSDHCSVGEDVDLPPWYERSEVQEDNSILYLREFERPLPEKAQNQESLDVHIHLKQMTIYYYFDGKDVYNLYQYGSTTTDVTAAIPRTDAVSRHFSAVSAYNGVPIEIDLDVSAVQATMQISSAQCAFPDLEAHQWYDVVLMDQSNRQLRTLETAFSENGASINFQGVGELPQSLTLYIGNWHEGTWNVKNFIASAVEIPISCAQ